MNARSRKQRERPANSPDAAEVRRLVARAVEAACERVGLAMSVLDKVTFDLGETRTYSRRMLEWIPGDVRGEGHAIVSQWKGMRAGSILERDLYQVVETQERPFAMAREFLWLNRGDATQEDVYRVLVTPHGTTCTCRAGKCKAPCCKHSDSVLLLIREQEL